MSQRHVNGHHAQPPQAHYNDAHRAFLQAFFSQSVFTLDELKPVVAAILTAQEPARPRFENEITQQIITSLVQTTNAKISPLDFEIRSARNQLDNNLTYALVNTTSDALTHLATSFTADEVAYIKRLLDAMFDENTTQKREVMAVREMRATQLAKAPRSRQSQAAAASADAVADADADADAEPTQVEAAVKSISNADSERVLRDLVSQGFFHRSRRAYYTLAPRALIELRAYLKETYNELPAEDDDEDTEPIIKIRDCEGCKEIVTIGLRCDNRDCGVRWHTRCANQYFGSQQDGARRCPKCRGEWVGNSFVGEKADRIQKRGSTVGRGSSVRVQEDGEDDDDDDDDDDERL